MLAAAMILSASTVSAQSAFEQFSVGALFGSEGAGLQVATTLTPSLQLRAGFAYLPYSLVGKQEVDIQSWYGIVQHPACKTTITETKNSGTLSLLLDWYPNEGSTFHVTAGALLGSATMFEVTNTTALPETYHYAGIDYFPEGNRSSTPTVLRSDSNGIYAGALRRNAVRPFAGIGFGSPFAGRTVGVTFDIGVEYTGGIGLYTDPSGSGSPDMDFRLDSKGTQEMFYDMRGGNKTKSYDKYLKYIDTLYKLPILPVVRLNVFFGAF